MFLVVYFEIIFKVFGLFLGVFGFGFEFDDWVVVLFDVVWGLVIVVCIFNVWLKFSIIVRVKINEVVFFLIFIEIVFFLFIISYVFWFVIF